MSDCKPVSTPMETATKLRRHYTGEVIESFNDQSYRTAVGMLLYLTIGSRPDIAFAVGSIARYQATPEKEHWEVVKRILRYLKGTMNYGIVYTGNKNRGEFQLIGYSDSDFANDVDDYKSVGGYIFMVNGTTFSYRSKKQTTVATSTVNAEYVALSDAACEAVWIRMLLEEMGMKQMKATTVYGDNAGSLQIAKNPAMHSKAKHIAVKYHFIRELVESQQVEVVKIGTKEQLADGMTKALPKATHLIHAKAYGISE